MRIPFKKISKTISGGIRVNDTIPSMSLVEVLCSAKIIWGLHNFRQDETIVKKGYLFYLIDSCGGWHDIIPLNNRKDKRYFRKVPDNFLGKEMTGDELYSWNKKNNKIIKEEKCTVNL